MFVSDALLRLHIEKEEHLHDMIPLNFFATSQHNTNQSV